MSDKTGIEWTDATWNPITGCTKVSPGCDNCYAETFSERFRGTPGHYFESGFDLQLRPDKIDQPLKWKKSRRIFVNSMSDLFHDDVPESFILGVFGVMAQASQHTFQILTKRHARMRSLLTRWATEISWLSNPLPNVWLGVSTEDQKWADIRIPALLDTPAAVRFISAEPLLGPINLRQSLAKFHPGDGEEWAGDRLAANRMLHWVIVGGESGRNARPMHPEWAASLRDQCVEAAVPFLFKQWGEWDASSQRVGKKAAGRELDGRTWDEFPGVPA
ncbi:protein gp37 [Rhodococcus sp. 27YEA15]|uniref:DUF5131 family protein n=1 Tax=Rhodococcus sp. 27YEA15 TaxID=3156259 RepID=UPI003C7DC458